MIDPFKITGPTCISFSGGRTSGYMLWRILQAHGGKLPDDVIVMFANTGKEHPATLDFVRDCGERWGVPIIWVEYRRIVDGVKQHALVSYDTASRDGEPYEYLIEDRKYLPNVFARFCTVELKIRPMHRVLKERGWTEWDSAVGLRADEPRRVAKLGNQDYGKHEERVAPLAKAGIGVREVLDFWHHNDFDLALPTDDVRTTHGNCDLCFLKPMHMMMSLIREDAERATWWIKMEDRVTEIGQAGPSGAVFRTDRPTYRQMRDNALNQGDMFSYGDEALDDCNCTD